MGRRQWTFDERVVLSMYCGVTIPVLYLFVVIVILGSFGPHLGESARDYLVLPLVWPARIIESLYHPRIQAVGDVLEAALFELIGTAAIDFFTYGLCVFLLLSIHNKINGVRTSPSST